ncbi:peptidase [Mycobacterium avium subsp. hominissuis]|uniref:Peptidase n=1 Tax=Mycobacterium avium subsp. hominissuis TaxID=439334 RepID=A0A3B6XAJ0_MYCAV|nr:peptidase [Mycobacterium avium]AXO23873.1 peptidase [Mycobacterium avium subsp. hominissuis]
MDNRRRKGRRARQSRPRGSIASAKVALVCAWAALLVTGCTTFVDGRGVSILNDPFRVAGLPAVDGPSGSRPDGPEPTGTVGNTNGGAIDTLALLSINDIEEYWKQAYGQPLHGSFTPVKELVSYDSDSPDSPALCRSETYRNVNAFFTSRCDVIAWDRGVFMPVGVEMFGDMFIPGALAHEYGHAIQQMAKLVTRNDPAIVREQQADCFAGVYLWWVAEGNSPRFRLSTGDGLDHVLAAVVATRDPVMDSDVENDDEHGSALDRISAFQIGFSTGAPACAAINMNEILQRRGDLPRTLRVGPDGVPQTGEVAINQDTLSTLMEVMGKIFVPRQPPTLSYAAPDCPGAKASPPASYCPDTNTITVDLPGLQKIGQVANEKEHSLPQGDDTALSIVMSRYVLAVQREHGLPLHSPWTALRTACLTGVAHRKMAEPIDLPSHHDLVLTAGDLDKVVSGLLTNHLVASDVDGVTVLAGFTRIAAFRAGLSGDEGVCYERFRG